MTTSDAPKFRRYAAEERAAMLVKAGLECLAEGGITAFTVDNICRRAEASRGLIAHHFGGKEGLLAAVYEAAYQPMLARIDLGDDPLPLGELLAVMADAEAHDRGTMNIWLALWGEVAVNPRCRRRTGGITGDTGAWWNWPSRTTPMRAGCGWMPARWRRR